MIYHSSLRLCVILYAVVVLNAAVLYAEEARPVKQWTANNNAAGSYLGVKWHPDGKSLFTFGNDAIITRWEVDSQKPIVTYKGSHSALNSFGLSSDGKRLATFDQPAAGEGFIRIFDCDKGTAVASLGSDALDGVFDYYPLAFSPDDKSLLIGAVAIFIWDMKSGKATPLDPTVLDKKSRVYGERQSILFSKNGDALIDRSEDIRVWDWKDRSVKTSFRAPNSSLQRAALTPDGSGLVMSEEPKCRTLEVWNTKTGKARKLRSQHKYEILAISISPDGAVVASASGEGTVHLSNLANGKVIHTISPKEIGGEVACLEFSPDGKTLATLGKSLRLWDVSKLIEESPSDSKAR